MAVYSTVTCQNETFCKYVPNIISIEYVPNYKTFYENVSKIKHYVNICSKNDTL